MDSVSCLSCHERFAKNRGNCILCYARHGKSVRAGKTTWAELEHKGLALPAKRRGQNWMPDWGPPRPERA
jgi:hypothetical protein